MFRFKEFEIVQTNTAMKVCTDSCVFGASIEVENHIKILDIGTGTGLLSLMIAQKNRYAAITAVEIEAGAFKDASYNIANSKFKNQVQVVQDSIQNYAIDKKQEFDLIICNPPFYINKLKSPKAAKNIAHHAETLNYEEIVSASETLLTDSGNLWILLPPAEMNKFIEIANQKNYWVAKTINLKHNANKPVFRQIVKFSKSTCHNPNTEEICFHEENTQQYSKRFIELLAEYYLIF